MTDRLDEFYFDPHQLTRASGRFNRVTRRNVLDKPEVVSWILGWEQRRISFLRVEKYDSPLCFPPTRKEFFMSSAVLMERFSLGSPTSSGPAQSWQSSGFPATGPAGNWCVVPRCKVEFEKCTGGFKIHCKCEDELSCGTLQNLCRMLCDGCCSCYCTNNGVQCCQCTFANCHCKCEYTADGCTISCTSGDKQCCAPVAGLLRLLRQVLRKRLLLLRVLRQHPGLLRKLLSTIAEPSPFGRGQSEGAARNLGAAHMQAVR